MMSCVGAWSDGLLTVIKHIIFRCNRQQQV